MDSDNKDAAVHVALVTGVAEGFGESLCVQLARSGHKVVGLARSDRVEQQISEQVGESGSTYRHIVCDVTNARDVKAAVDDIEKDQGAIDVLVHNAHRLLVKPFDETDLSEFQAVWETACFGAAATAQAVIPHMLARERGTIIFTGATAAVRGGAKFSAFASAKFALRGLAQSLAREYGPRGIHVVHTILDGLIWEPQTRERFAPEQGSCLDAQALANAYLHVIRQPPSAWTHELDLRPFSENF